MKKFLVAVALSVLLAACGGDTGRDSIVSRNNSAFGPTFPVSDDGKAALYIVRDVASPDAPPINVSVNGQPMSGLASRTYMRLNLSPQLYDLRAYGTQTNNELIITVAPGQSRFLLAQPAPKDSAELLELSMEQGRRLVRNSELIWSPDIE